MIKNILISLFILCTYSNHASAGLKNSFDAIIGDEQCIVAIADFSNGDIIYHFNNIDDGEQAYAPGSTIKLMLSILLVQSGLDETLKVECYSSSPETPIGERCWLVSGHGGMNFTQAFAHSCNRYFMKGATKINPDDFMAILSEFSLNDNVNQVNMNHEDMIGLGLNIRVRPLDLLAAYTAVLNGGILYRWYQGSDGSYKSVVRKNLNIPLFSGGRRFRIKTAMVACSESGTASAAGKGHALSPFPAKTGTSYYMYKNEPDYKKTHGWFVGFYPNDDTKIAVLVFILDGKGTKEASFLGAKIIDEYKKTDK